MKLIKGNDGEQGCGIADIQEVMSANLPRDFRWMDKGKGLKYSGALCVTQHNQLHETRGTYRGVIELMIHGQIRDGLGGRSGHGTRSMFDRLVFTEDDGSALRVTTHQFRHYLSTVAQAGGLSQLDIAKWSGRKDVRQYKGRARARTERRR